MPASQFVSIVIVNWNGAETLLQTLRSLQDALDGVQGSDIILVDNASTDGSADKAEKCFPKVKVIRNRTNLGFGAANNAGFKQARGRYVLILNPDAQLDRPALDTLVGFMEAHPQAGTCGPRVLEAGGRAISPWCARRDPRPLDVFFETAYLFRLFPKHRLFARYTLGDWSHAEDRPVDALTGACMLVRREVIEQTGGFDEQFFMYGEDLDWCRRIRQAGWQVWFVAGAAVQHPGAHSTRQVSDRGARWAVESYIRYFRKWGTPLDVLKTRAGLSLGSAARSAAWLAAALLPPSRFRYALSRSAGYLQCAVLSWTT